MGRPEVTLRETKGCSRRGTEKLPLQAKLSRSSSQDLIEEGYGGEELYKEYVYRKSQIAPALETMISEERPKAKTYTWDTLEDLFNEDDEE